jgi:adenylate kinase family enzyme
LASARLGVSIYPWLGGLKWAYLVLERREIARTVILGNSGSGKSWLAEEFALLIGNPTTDLDLIHWLPGGFNARRDPGLAIAVARDVAADENWTIEGAYGWLAEQVLPRATALIHLDIDEEECASNVRARGIRRGSDEVAFSELLDWVANYRMRQSANSLAGHTSLLMRSRDQSVA